MRGWGGGASGCVVGYRGGVGRVWGVVGVLWGVVGVGVGFRGACVGRVWGAIRVGIARSALLSGYLGKSGHLPRFIIYKHCYLRLHHLHYL